MAKSRSSSRADGITVREIGRRRFEVDFTYNTVNGPCRKRLISPESTIGKSREWALRERRILIERGDAPRVEPRVDPASPRDFRYWATRYLEDAENPARRGGENRPGTLLSKKSIVELHLIPAFGRRLVTAIDDDLVEQYAGEKLRAHLAIGTVKGHLSKLRSILHLARRKGAPVERALIIPAYQVGSRDQDLPATLSEAQTDEVLKVFAEGEWHLALLALLFRCGLRIGEALGLRWGDINFERRTVLVQRSAGKHGVGRTKSGKVRSVRLHHQAARALDAMGVGEGWVFPGRDCRRPRSYQAAVDAIGARWPDLRDEHGNLIAWRSHMGRHSFGRHWVSLGGHQVKLQRVLGHADLKTTQTYMHWSSDDDDGELLEQLGTRPKPKLVRTPRARE
jgi:integrase